MWAPAFELMPYELVAGLENVPRILWKSHNKKNNFPLPGIVHAL